MIEKLIRTTLACTAFALGASSQAKPPPMWAYDIGTLYGAPCIPTAMNDSGQVIGYVLLSDNSQRWFITGPNGVGPSDLGTIEGHPVVATAINSSAQLVGQYFDRAVNAWRTFISAPGGKDLRSLDIPLDVYAAATGINDSGQVVGYTEKVVGDNYIDRPFITGANGVGFTQLGTLGGDSAQATAINTSGQVVGWSYIPGHLYRRHAFITGPNGVGMTDLGAGDASDSRAAAINDAGQVAGQLNYYKSKQSNGSSEFVTGPNGQGMINLGALNKDKRGIAGAASINQNGIVVGLSELHPRRDIRATITNGHNEVTNLNRRVVNLPAGLDLGLAIAINASGQIAAFGGDGHGYIVCPRENCAPE